LPTTKEDGLKKLIPVPVKAVRAFFYISATTGYRKTIKAPASSREDTGKQTGRTFLNRNKTIEFTFITKLKTSDHE
jgi:hypothetical protein